MVGRVISHYEVLEKLGEGGMGVVYKARDARLDRFVALKVLHAQRVSDEERQRWFVREAKAASSLNNPHIVTIYDIDSEDGLSFIAMEYIEGRTLRELIPPQGLPPAEALKYAVQIADALAAVHARGIIHRDLKPGNVMVARNRCAKVLDFGLAKLVEAPRGEDSSTQMNTISTIDGAVVGTAAYMSPEQAEGKAIDARSDIFAFGAVFYQMLTGRPPFHGATKISTITSILHSTPIPPGRINPVVPPEMERIVLCCLEKDPDRRFQHAVDLKMALEWLERDSESFRTTGPKMLGLPVPPARRNLLQFRNVAAALLSVGVLTATAGYLVSRWRAAIEAPENLQQITDDPGLTCSPALSPDGKLLAYASDRSDDGGVAEKSHIWLRRLPDGKPVRLTNAPFDDFSPSFTPDGRNVVFERSEAGISIISVAGGPEKRIARSGSGPRCSPDGKRLVYWVGNQDNTKPSGRVYIAPINQGDFPGDSAVDFAEDFAVARYPIWANDGNSVIFQGRHSLNEKDELWIKPIDGGPPRNSGILQQFSEQKAELIQGPGDWVGSHLLFSAITPAGRHIWFLEYPDASKPAPGAIAQLTFGNDKEGEPVVTRSGRVIFARYSSHDALKMLRLNGGGTLQDELQPLRELDSRDSHPSLSADARMLAFLSGPPDLKQVWVLDLASGKEQPLTSGGGTKSAPALSADGSQVAYSVQEKGGTSIYVSPTAIAPPGRVPRAYEKCGEPADWTRDGRAILFQMADSTSIWMLNLNSSVRSLLLQHPDFGLRDPRLSPDGRWIAFVAAAAGSDHSRIFVAPFRDGLLTPPAEWVGATDGTAGDSKPAWLASDTLVYYSKRDQFGGLWKQRLDPATRHPIGSPTQLYGFHTFRESPRPLFESGFSITVAQNTLVLNQVELSGNLWSASIPRLH
jgi:serine/threonine protein kinase